jgi:GTP cyclohydrolase IA
MEPSDALVTLIEQLIQQLGEAPVRAGLAGTPKRMAEWLRHLTEGYSMDATMAIGEALYEHDSEQLVVVRNIPFYSICEHHLLPFFGVVHVGYIPRSRIIGLSKIPRLIDVFAHRLQTQERLTSQIADNLSAAIGADGVAVVIEARHLCMEMRGVKRMSHTVTSCWLGRYKDDSDIRHDFLALVQRPESVT